MKKLELKEQPKPKVTKKSYMATTALNVAREKIKDFLAYEIPLIYNAIFGDNPNFEEDEEYTLYTGDIGDISINVEADNSYLDVEDICYERVEVAEIILALDGTIIVRDEDGNEWNDLELSCEDLEKISNKIQDACRRICTKK